MYFFSKGQQKNEMFVHKKKTLTSLAACKVIFVIFHAFQHIEWHSLSGWNEQGPIDLSFIGSRVCWSTCTTLLTRLFEGVKVKVPTLHNPS